MELLKVGIIGLGRIGKIHLDNLLKIPNVEVVVAVNPSEAGQSYAKALGVPCVTSNVNEIFDNAEIDAVAICSSTDTHAEFIIRSVESGKAVFCEKPLDLSLETVKETVKKVKATDVPLMMAFNQRFDEHFSAIKSAVGSGRIGEPHMLHIISRDPGPPPIAYIKTSGGLFKDMTIHDFDMARFIMGSEVVEVFAKGHNLIDPAIGKAGDIDTGILLLTFENNATAIIQNSRKAVYGYDQRLEIFGSKGMMRCENPLKTTNHFYDGSGGHSDRHLDFFIDRYEKAYRLEMEAFINALRNKTPMPVTEEDGLQAMRIAEAANRSLLESRPVKLRDI